MKENTVSEADIIAYYLTCRSIKQTARHFGCWHGVVRRMLINNGLYTSTTANKVNDLTECGKSAAEIADALGVSASTVNSYLPYTKGTYIQPSETTNAQRVRRHRLKKQEREEE